MPTPLQRLVPEYCIYTHKRGVGAAHLQRRVQHLLAQQLAHDHVHHAAAAVLPFCVCMPAVQVHSFDGRHTNGRIFPSLAQGLAANAHAITLTHTIDTLAHTHKCTHTHTRTCRAAQQAAQPPQVPPCCSPARPPAAGAGRALRPTLAARVLGLLLHGALGLGGPWGEGGTGARASGQQLAGWHARGLRAVAGVAREGGGGGGSWARRGCKAARWARVAELCGCAGPAVTVMSAHLLTCTPSHPLPITPAHHHARTCCMRPWMVDARAGSALAWAPACAGPAPLLLGPLPAGVGR